jgi:hypothetical protein
MVETTTTDSVVPIELVFSEINKAFADRTIAIRFGDIGSETIAQLLTHPLRWQLSPQGINDIALLASKDPFVRLFLDELGIVTKLRLLHLGVWDNCVSHFERLLRDLCTEGNKLNLLPKEHTGCFINGNLDEQERIQFLNHNSWFVVLVYGLIGHCFQNQ